LVSAKGGFVETGFSKHMDIFLSFVLFINISWYFSFSNTKFKFLSRGVLTPGVCCASRIKYQKSADQAIFYLAKSQVALTTGASNS
jgi:hypothetical protein